MNYIRPACSNKPRPRVQRGAKGHAGYGSARMRGNSFIDKSMRGIMLIQLTHTGAR